MEVTYTKSVLDQGMKARGFDVMLLLMFLMLKQIKCNYEQVKQYNIKINKNYKANIFYNIKINKNYKANIFYMKEVKTGIKQSQPNF